MCPKCIWSGFNLRHRRFLFGSPFDFGGQAALFDPKVESLGGKLIALKPFLKTSHLQIKCLYFTASNPIFHHSEKAVHVWPVTSRSKRPLNGVIMLTRFNCPHLLGRKHLDLQGPNAKIPAEIEPLKIGIKRVNVTKLENDDRTHLISPSKQ